jgi:hypothetical protein
LDLRQAKACWQVMSRRLTPFTNLEFLFIESLSRERAAPEWHNPALVNIIRHIIYPIVERQPRYRDSMLESKLPRGLLASRSAKSAPNIMVRIPPESLHLEPNQHFQSWHFQIELRTPSHLRLTASLEFMEGMTRVPRRKLENHRTRTRSP